MGLFCKVIQISMYNVLFIIYCKNVDSMLFNVKNVKSKNVCFFTVFCQAQSLERLALLFF